MSHPLSFEVDELINLAIMGKEPLVIVEGIDDIPIYENILVSIDRDFEVFASENLPKISSQVCSKLYKYSWRIAEFKINGKSFAKSNNGKEGCLGVIDAVEEIQKYSEGYDYSKYILGIIDKDVHDYKNTIPQLDGIFLLKYYSIESHYVNKEVIPQIINYTTLASYKLIDDFLINRIYIKLLSELSKMYYISLEALKNACCNDYNSEFRYKPDSYEGIIKHPDFEQKYISIESKKEELDIFADSKSITNNEENLLKIVKGKWYLENFLFLLGKELKELKNYCKNNAITQCQYCSLDKHRKCLYKVNSYNSEQIKKLIFKNEKLSSLNYIKERILELEY